MNRYRLLLTVAIIMLLHVSARAQQLRASLSHYSTDDGLSSNAIANIIQDDHGYIWIATWNGLSRFDGFNFYNYKTGNASHIPNLHNRIYSLVSDHQQNIWMRMYDGRIFVLNRQTDRIINPFDNVSGSDDYRSDIPPFLMSNGDVLAAFGSNVGMYRMRLEKGSPVMDQITTANHTVYSIAEGYHDDIWVGTDKGLHRIDISNLSIERKGLFEDEVVTALYSNGYNVYAGCQSGAIYVYSYGQEPRQIRQATGSGILTVFVDSHDLVWFADSRPGDSRLNPKTHDEKHFEQTVLTPEHDGIGSDFNEVSGVLWMRMNHGGYGYYNREKDEVEYFHNDPSNPWNLSNTVNACRELPEGVIFISTTRRGLEKLEILRDNITRKMLVPGSEAPLDNEIRGMFYDRQRKLLLMANKNNTLFVFHHSGAKTVINHDNAGNPLGRIYGIAKDSKGNYWLSSKDHGLFMMTPKAGGGFSLTNYCHDDNNKYSLSNNAAYQTVEDRQGNIWVATYGGGVNVLTHDKNGKPIFLNAKNEMRKYPRNSFMKMRTIALDKDGRVWAGSTDGILLMSLKDGKISIEKMQNSEEEPEKILMSTDIVYMVADKHGYMWVGTNGGGLAHATGKDSRGTWLFESFGSKEGLPSEEIKGMTLDLNGNVWFATDHILCSYDVSKKIFTTYSNLDGVDETMCSEGSAITMPNGNILFGTLNGYYVVDRRKLVTDNGSMLKLRITDFYLNGELVSPNLNDYYDYYVPEAKRVVLPHHDLSFSFRFAAMNYQLQHRMNYQYKLEGYDVDWRNADKKRTASYSNIPTGTYRFKVKAFLLESPDKYDIRVIEVVVPPYFLLSSKAVWLYMLIILIASLTLMFWRQHYLANKHKNMKVIKIGSREMGFVNDKDYDFVNAQMTWLETQYSNPDLKVEQMIAKSGLEHDEYVEQLKALTGKTPKEFISDFRMKKAIIFIENTSDSVALIAEKTGFSDPIYFTRAFKQETGLTPSKYRELKSGKKSGQTSDQPTQHTVDQPTQHTEDQPTQQTIEQTDDYEIIE